MGDSIKKDRFFYLILISQGLMLIVTLIINFYFKIEVFSYLLPDENHHFYILFGFLSGLSIYFILYIIEKVKPRVFKKINKIMRQIPLKKENIPLIIFLPAIIEELFFRGILQEFFGVIGTNIAFAIAHMGNEKDLIFYGIVSFLIGIIFSILYILANNLLLPMLAHGTINALTVRRLIKNKRVSKEKT